ncbi:MAG TPA: fluoride efflux transporter CrcB [Candidatus Xenobia bacterium]|nr:fluoride efflux transporter CrcB [Candidatus Xenobia bacterium]
MALRILLLIVFGALGTLARYGLQGLVQYRTSATFPTGTLAVNLLGCFLLGGVAQYALQRLSISPEWRIGLTIGFMGAFTTFSTFGYETVKMLEDGEWGRAALYVALSVAGGILAVLAGIRLADAL